MDRLHRRMVIRLRCKALDELNVVQKGLFMTYSEVCELVHPPAIKPMRQWSERECDEIIERCEILKVTMNL